MYRKYSYVKLYDTKACNTKGVDILKSCFFIGHREADERLLSILVNTIERLVASEDVTCFYVGGYGGFDRIATTAVKQVKQRHPGIILMLVLSYHPAERPVATPHGFDGTYYPEGMETVPRRFAIVRANKCMVDNVDWLIAYVRHGASNSRKILEYAQRQGLHCININNLMEGTQ